MGLMEKWEDSRSVKEKGLISDLPTKDTKLLRYIYHLAELQRENEEEDTNRKLNNKTKIAERAEMHKQTVLSKAESLEDEGFVEIEDVGKQETAAHELTEKGWKLYQSILPLFFPFDDFIKFLEEFKSKTLRYPDKEEIEEEFGDVTETALNQLDDYEKPDKDEKERKAELLREILKMILVTEKGSEGFLQSYKDLAAEQNELTWDKGDFGRVEKYWEENEELISKFHCRAKGDLEDRFFVCEVPSELKRYTMKSELEFSVRDAHENIDTHLIAKFPDHEETSTSVIPEENQIDPENPPDLYEYKWPIEPIKNYIQSFRDSK